MKKKKKIPNHLKANPKRTPQPAKQHWLQSTHQYRKDIFVSTGLSAKEMVREIKKFKPKKYILDFIEKRESEWKEIIEKNCAFVTMEESHGVLFIRLREYQDSWEFWETLIHELSHLLDFMAGQQKWETETEARAYLQEYLFHEIRRKLQGIVPKNSNGK